ncbi:DNA-directed RNA polymerase I subunit RPA34.5-domain-containing protein [Hypoxylon argillaceum]|nr:DNA-directed RNA polymerase I subunit RPA34.5-domain-containing protein [Hypoxylon argillaceum]
MRNTKANIGSLSSMASKVRQEKKNSASAKAKAPLARARDAKKPVQDSSSTSDSDSESSSSAESANGSDGEDDIGAARAKFLAKQAAKQNKAVGTKVNGAKPVAATPAKPVQRGGTPTSAQKPADDSSSDSSSESESESETSDSTSKPVTSQIKSSASKAKSGSSSQSSGPSNGVKAANKKVVNGNASESEESEDSEDSDSSSDDEDTPRTGAQVNGNGPAKGPVTTTQDASSDEEESDSGSESDDEGNGGKTAVARTNGTDAAMESTSPMSRPQWLNNADFMLRKASSSNPGKEVADFFSNANLEGKQVWYFTAPASLPITVLKDMEIDLSKATKGAPLLTHEGDNYGLDLESYATNTQIQLLIPSSGGDQYTSLNHNIDSTVHLRRMAKFGPGGEVQATATTNYVPVPKPIREQPDGLKVRYTPIGVPAPAPANPSLSQAKTTTRVESSSSSEGESESDSDVEMTTPLPSAAPASQTKSAKSGMTNGDRKRKHPGDETKATKRFKAELSTQVSSAKKHSPLQTPSSSAISNPTPSKKPSTKAKDKKVKATKDKTPKAVAMTPTTAKRTPIPLPSYPGMKR